MPFCSWYSFLVTENRENVFSTRIYPNGFGEVVGAVAGVVTANLMTTDKKEHDNAV